MSRMRNDTTIMLLTPDYGVNNAEDRFSPLELLIKNESTKQTRKEQEAFVERIFAEELFSFMRVNTPLDLMGDFKENKICFEKNFKEFLVNSSVYHPLFKNFFNELSLLLKSQYKTLYPTRFKSLVLEIENYH